MSKEDKTYTVHMSKNGQYFVTLPKVLAEAINIRSKDRIRWKLDRGDLVMRKA